MPHAFQRGKRVGEQIKRELAAIIQRRAEETQWGMLTITAVALSRDLRHAKVFFTRLNTEGVAADIESALNQQSGNLRHLLGQQLRIKFIPELQFIHDESIERATRVDMLLDAVRRGCG
ncbi:MAG: 30S ribosome-binding factor RbfA [Gammaproteobacteria bacterium]